MAKKKTSISFTVGETMLAMIEAVRQKGDYDSRSAVAKSAIRQMYNRNFPSYGGKPTPVPTAGNTPMAQARAVAQARVLNKKVQTSEEEADIIESGKNICRLLSGRVVGESGGIDTVGMDFERMDNGPVMQVQASKFIFKDLPVDYFTQLDKNYPLQAYLLESKFRDLDLSATPERLRKKFQHIQESFSEGARRGEIKPKDMTRTLCELLMKRMEEAGVDCTSFKETLSNEGFLNDPVE